VRTESRIERAREYPTEREAVIPEDMPVVVLINRFSASASEIVAGALKDYGRAIIVGDRSTFGKGTVQNVIGLPRSLGALKTTVAKFYRPGSSSTQNLGVQSHIVLPSLNNHADIGESSLANAMPWDAVQPARFSRWADLSSIVPALDALTVQRRKTNPDFQQIVTNVRNYVSKRKGRKEIRLQEVVQDSSGSNSDSAAPGKVPNGKPADEDPTDVYLNEALEILADFIEIKSRQSSGGRVVAQ
jgi:carboxyl-terminal processing protease